MNPPSVTSSPFHKLISPLVTKSKLDKFFSGIKAVVEFHKPELDQFFANAGHRVKQAEKDQQRVDIKHATRFNVFDLIEPDENKLSDILADLLDPSGTHGQKDLFLQLLFKQLGVPVEDTFTKVAKVKREAPTHGIQKYRRRIDVLVEAGALLAIENKVDSLEQRDQIKDYLEHLQYCTQGNKIRSVLIYLTPDKRFPDSLNPLNGNTETLKCWS